MTPDLALVYSSGAGMDSLGLGWSVRGAISMIRPCAPTFASDGRAGFPDKFCLDQQPLVDVGGVDIERIGYTSRSSETPRRAVVFRYEPAPSGAIPPQVRVWRSAGACRRGLRTIIGRSLDNATGC